MGKVKIGLLFAVALLALAGCATIQKGFAKLGGVNNAPFSVTLPDGLTVTHNADGGTSITVDHTFYVPPVQSANPLSVKKTTPEK